MFFKYCAKLTIQAVETDIVEISKRVNELAGIKVPIHNNMLMPLALNANMN